jgi:hypothetical protein
MSTISQVRVLFFFKKSHNAYSILSKIKRNSATYYLLTALRISNFIASRNISLLYESAALWDFYEHVVHHARLPWWRPLAYVLASEHLYTQAHKADADTIDQLP